MSSYEFTFYYAEDKILQDPVMAPLGYVHSLTPPGFPPYELVLNRFCHVELLKDHFGYKSGTKLEIMELGECIKARPLVSGITQPPLPFIIPRMHFVYNGPGVPFSRLQYPVKILDGTTLYEKYDP